MPHSVEEMARDAVAFIRALGLEHVDLLGFSLGGGVAQVIAMAQPELVRRVILADTGPAGGGGISERTEDRDKRISPLAMRAQLEAIRAFGDTARRIPDARLRIYPDSGHGGLFQYHRDFVAEVLAFLER